MQSETNESPQLNAERTRQPIGCGVEGCLTAAVVLFAVLIILILVMVFARVGGRL